jgi:broad specificity phosphatase PhoE
MLTSRELHQWLDEYDASDVEPTDVDLGATRWDSCYASPLYRAYKTAETIYDGEVIQMEALREVRPDPILNNDVRLPFIAWPLLLRLAWFVNHASQTEGRADVERRVANVLDDILARGGQEILIVSHGGIMAFLRKELLRRGYFGPKFGIAENATLYVFEK